MILLNLKVTRFSLKENPARVLPNTCRVIIKVNLNYVDITISKRMNLQKILSKTKILTKEDYSRISPLCTIISTNVRLVLCMSETQNTESLCA